MDSHMGVGAASPMYLKQAPSLIFIYIYDFGVSDLVYTM